MTTDRAIWWVNLLFTLYKHEALEQKEYKDAKEMQEARELIVNNLNTLEEIKSLLSEQSSDPLNDLEIIGHYLAKEAEKMKGDDTNDK